MNLVVFPSYVGMSKHISGFTGTVQRAACLDGSQLDWDWIVQLGSVFLVEMLLVIVNSGHDYPNGLLVVMQKQSTYHS